MLFDVFTHCLYHYKHKIIILLTMVPIIFIGSIYKSLTFYLYFLFCVSWFYFLFSCSCSSFFLFKCFCFVGIIDHSSDHSTHDPTNKKNQSLLFQEIMICCWGRVSLLLFFFFCVVLIDTTYLFCD